MNDLQTFANSDTGYIQKLNNNFSNVKDAVDSLETNMSAQIGAALTGGAAFSALFGPSVALVGALSCLCHGSGAILTVDAGFYWNPGTSLVVKRLTSSTLDFTGLGANTYYIQISDTGVASRSTSPTSSIYSVVWTGSAFGTITRTAVLVFGAADDVLSQTSTALGASYVSVDARLEAGETITKASQTSIATYGTGATLIKDTDGTLAANSDSRVATQKAVKTFVAASVVGLGSGDVVGPGSAVDSHFAQFDTTTGKLLKDGGLALDTGSLSTNSDSKIPSQKAVKTYVDAAVVGLLDDRGNYDASGNVFPSSGGSGSAGVIVKGDIWYISVAGTLGGVAVTVGSSVRALVDTPGSTSGNWDILNVGLGYVPENVANKDTDVTLAANSDTKYASQKAVKAYIATQIAGVSSGGTETTTTMGTLTHGAASKGTPVDADEIPLADSAASWIWKKLTWANLKTTLKTYFDTLYPSGSGTSTGTNTGDQTSVTGNAGTATALATARAIDGQNFDGTAAITVIAPGTHAATSKATPVDADELPLVDSAAANVLKKLTWANLKATLKTYFDTLYATVSQPFDLSAFYPGIPTASAIVTRIPVARAVTFPDEFAGSYGVASAAATASTAFDVQKNGSSVGTITFALGATTATFVTSGTTVVMAAGDVLKIVAPASPDATLADVGFVLTGTR